MIWVLWAACAHPAAPRTGGGVYEVDGVAVDAAAWERALTRLDGPQLGWTCAETSDGGEVSWWQRRGAEWVYVVEGSFGGRTESSLRTVDRSEVPAHLRGE